MIILIVLSVVTLFSLSIAGYAWWHASRWAKLIAYGRIVVEYKNKVKMDAPLREWALWCNQTRKDKSQPLALRGHVIYSLGGTRIALFAGKKHAKVRPVKQRPGSGARTIQSREGTWARNENSDVR